MASSERQELIRNAVSFLSDFSSQQAPLTQRVQFLEAKGLTGPEIEEAMKQAANQTSHAQPQPALQYQSSYYGPPPYSGIPPPHQQWDWRDYFITAVVSGTIAYGAVSLFQKYMLPHLKPPTATAYEQDRDALTAQFDAAEALLKEIQAETASVRAAVEEQKEKVDKATKDVEAVVVEMREGETKARGEMREIRDEVENIREMLPKMIEKNKETQKQSLAELQQELKSLKALLLSRGTSGLTSSPSTPLPGPVGKPSIPSWQLAATKSNFATPSSESLTDVASQWPGGPFIPPLIPNGKGKEIEDLAVESS
jgi:peroxin-14